MTHDELLAAAGCRAWRSITETKLAQELSAQRIYQDVVSAHDYSGSYYSVRRLSASSKPANPSRCVVWNAPRAKRPRSRSCPNRPG